VTLDHIVGQAVPVSILRQALGTRTLGHAYLFSGPRGLGKEKVARAVAEELRIQGGPLSEIHVLAGDATIRIDDVRVLRSKAALAASGNSIWIILDADRLRTEGANALLKTLEEPPARTYFFLTTTRTEDLPTTIVSRCQHLPFRRISDEEIAQWLANRTQTSPQDAKIRTIARLAKGSLGAAWAYWEGDLLEERQAVLSKLIQVPKASYPEVLGLSYSWPEDRKKIKQELQLFLEWYRDLLVIKNDLDLPLCNPDYEGELKEISAYYTNDDVYVIMEQIIEMGKALAGNGRIRFGLGYLLLLMKKGALT
jgi:DNA polymerase-3 subunit delta'